MISSRLRIDRPSHKIAKYAETSIFMKSTPFIIGVAGGTGSGKTTVTRAIADCLNPRDVLIIEHDSYYRDQGHLPVSGREGINYDHPDALQTELLVEHIKELKSWRRVNVPVYDFQSHTRKKKGRTVEPAGTVIIEGILILADTNLRQLMDIRIFVDTDDDIRFIRRLQRDVKDRGRTSDSVIEQYMKTVRPMHIEFVEPSRRYADVIIPEGHNPAAIDMVVSMIRDRLGNRRHS